jgi:hypothetical protein
MALPSASTPSLVDLTAVLSDVRFGPTTDVGRAPLCHEMQEWRGANLGDTTP